MIASISCNVASFIFLANLTFEIILIWNQELQTGFSFYYMRRSKSGKTHHPIQEGGNAEEPDVLLDGSKAEAFTDAVKKIGTVRNVEDFWTMYDHVSF